MTDTIAVCRKLEDEFADCDCPTCYQPCLQCKRNVLEFAAIQCDCPRCPSPWGEFCSDNCVGVYHAARQPQPTRTRSRLACHTPRPKTLRAMLAHVLACPHPACADVAALYVEVVAAFRAAGARLRLAVIAKEN